MEKKRKNKKEKLSFERLRAFCPYYYIPRYSIGAASIPPGPAAAPGEGKQARGRKSAKIGRLKEKKSRGKFTKRGWRSEGVSGEVRGGVEMTVFDSILLSHLSSCANSFEITFSLPPLLCLSSRPLRFLMERREVTFTSFLLYPGMKNFHPPLTSPHPSHIGETLPEGSLFT